MLRITDDPAERRQAYVALYGVKRSCWAYASSDTRLVSECSDPDVNTARSGNPGHPTEMRGIDELIE